MNLIIEPEIEYYVNVIPLTIELTDEKTPYPRSKEAE